MSYGSAKALPGQKVSPGMVCISSVCFGVLVQSHAKKASTTQKTCVEQPYLCRNRDSLLMLHVGDVLFAATRKFGEKQLLPKLKAQSNNRQFWKMDWIQFHF